MSQSSFKDRRIFLAILLIAFGSVWLLRSIDMLPFAFPFSMAWKTGLMALGLILLFTEKNRSTGTTLFLIGSFFLVKEIYGFSFGDMFRIALPVILIVAGLSILFRKSLFQRKEYNDYKLDKSENDDIDTLNDVSIFGGGVKIITTSNFKGGQCTAIFGGSEINLSQVQLAEGKNVIDILAIFGGATFIIPDDWTVKIDVNAVFGGFSDSRIKHRPLNPDPKKEIHFKGLVIFGGGELKCF